MAAPGGVRPNLDCPVFHLSAVVARAGEKIGYLKIGRFFLAAAVNIVLVLCYSVWGL